MRAKKSLSFGEKKILETARSLLVKEIACAEEIKETEVAQKIEGFFHAQAA